MQRKRTGRPKGSGVEPPESRFWRKVTKTDSCWLWTGSVTQDGGYGKFSLVHSDWIPAHRFSYSINVGPIPDGLWVLHHCDNPPCVRPDHLFVGTAFDNYHDMIAKGRQNFTAARNPVRGEAHQWHIDPRRGVRHPSHRLTDGLVLYIREQARTGRTQISLAIELGVSPMTISRVVRRRLWTHI